MDAQSLRAQALELLKQAHELDGLQPYSITHEHKYGAGSYIGWFNAEPSEEQAVAILDVEFEPERNETIYVNVLDLAELTGPVQDQAECETQAAGRLRGPKD